MQRRLVARESICFIGQLDSFGNSHSTQLSAHADGAHLARPHARAFGSSAMPRLDSFGNSHSTQLSAHADGAHLARPHARAYGSSAMPRLARHLFPKRSSTTVRISSIRWRR